MWDLWELAHRGVVARIVAGGEGKRKRGRERGGEDEKARETGWIDTSQTAGCGLWFVVCGLWFSHSLVGWLHRHFPPRLNSTQGDWIIRGERERGVQYVLFLRLVSSCDPYTDPLVFLARIA